ncbi:MAG: hypothetical protein ACTHK8_14085 [Ginsengibacter sp.]
MCEGYSLKWLDYLVTLSLNPKKINLGKILPEQITYLESKIEKEKIDQEFFLKNEVFNLLDEKKIRLLINQYHSALIILLDQAFENKKKIKDNDSSLKQLFNGVIACLGDLLSFVELRFRIYLEPEERVSITYLSRFKEEVKLKTKRLRNELGKTDKEQAANILLNFLDSFSQSDEGRSSATYQQLLYMKELLEELETFNTPYAENEIFTKFDRILIYLNFNSKLYINFLIQKIKREKDSLITIKDKINYLQFQFKEFIQLIRKPGTALNPEQTNLTEVLSNWFTEELSYLERKLSSSAIPSKSTSEVNIQKPLNEKNKSKILCTFSTDQIAIMLRALDELQVIKARSMSAVFKTIVPHLSTPYKEDLSYDAVRSKSYAAEESDKRIVIATLQDLIEKVKRY